jgi:hypothetical protein
MLLAALAYSFAQVWPVLVILWGIVTAFIALATSLVASSMARNEAAQQLNQAFLIKLYNQSNLNPGVKYHNDPDYYYKMGTNGQPLRPRTGVTAQDVGVAQSQDQARAAANPQASAHSWYGRLTQIGSQLPDHRTDPAQLMAYAMAELENDRRQEELRRRERNDQEDAYEVLEELRQLFKQAEVVMGRATMGVMHNDVDRFERRYHILMQSYHTSLMWMLQHYRHSSEKRNKEFWTPAIGPYRRGYTEHTLKNPRYNLPVASVLIDRGLGHIRGQFEARAMARRGLL